MPQKLNASRLWTLVGTVALIALVVTAAEARFDRAPPQSGSMPSSAL